MRLRDIIAACLLAGSAACASPADRAARLAAEGQAAIDRGDYPAAREALVRAVQSDDDQPLVWSALGRVLLQMGDVGGAYQAYARVAELDRTNAEALQILADVSLMSGRTREAERYANQLELLRPGDPGPATTKGFLALMRNRPKEALQAADAVLARAPFDGGASILKARALDALGSNAEGARVLEAVVDARGPTKPVLDNLLDLYRKAEFRPGILRTRARLAALQPDDAPAALAYARELYGAGDLDAGRRLTSGLVGSEAKRVPLDDVLALWRAHETPEQAVRNARALEASASPSERVAISRLLLDLGQASQAEALLRDRAGADVATDSADAIAVFAAARAAQGDRDQAMALLDKVLAFDPANTDALRARADLHLAVGRTEHALADARRLVGERPTDAEDRLRLARVYLARRQVALAESTYWQAFNDIPGNAAIYGALKRHLRQSGNTNASAALDRRFAEQKQTLRTRRA